MSPTRRPSNDRPDGRTRGERFRRREFLAFGTATGATLLAGCSASSVPGGPDAESTSTSDQGEVDGNAGTFRLLISDRPADIADFDSLDVSFDRARIFGGGGAEPDEETEPPTASPTETVTTTGSTPPSETASPTESPPSTDARTGTSSPDSREDVEPEGEGEGERGFQVLDLGGATVDLTQVVGERAIGIGEEDVPEGKYTKIELHASGVEGIVDGEPVDVKIPSGKLQITKPFVVGAGETVSFVFDINVVKKGQSDAYNLLPVISESGVAGEDVEVEEVGNEGATGADEPGESDEATGETGTGAGEGNDASEGKGDGPPDDGAGGSEG